MQNAKEEVRSRLNIEEVIGEYVRLQRAGRSFKGLSPFTQEKTPSFMVSPDKQVWYDFSSNKGGDIFSFIMEVEGLDFRGSLELLARKAGVDLGLYHNQDTGMSAKKKRLSDLLHLSMSYYQQTLFKNDRALEYVFKTRGLNKQVVADFGIGFAPDTRDAATSFLKKKGFSQSEIKEAGMSNSRGGDLFRSRIVLPLHDPSGQVIGFTGRLLGEDKNAPKYLNTPQTLLYDKSRHVFGLHLAKESIRKHDQAILVEGNLDVVSSHQAGITNVVAAAGTALTEQHLRVLKRFTPHITLALDSDKAGVAATERTIPIAQGLDVSLKIISLGKDAKDPDELVREDPEAWHQAIVNAQPVVDWVFSEYERRYDIATAEGKRLFSSASLKVIKNLKDPVEKEHYVQLVAEKTGARRSAVEAKLENTEGIQQEGPLRKIHVTQEGPIQAKDSQQEALLSLAVFDPSVRVLLVDTESLHGPEAQALLDYLKVHTEESLTGTFPPELHEYETYVKILLLRADAKYAAWSTLDRYDEAAKLVRALKNNTRQQTKRHLQAELHQAESANDDETSRRLRQELNNLIKEIG